MGVKQIFWWLSLSCRSDRAGKQEALREEAVGDFLSGNLLLVVSRTRELANRASTYFSKLLKSR